MKILIICGIAWTLAQAIKTIVAVLQSRTSKHKGEKISFIQFFDSGGMPSSHSAAVMALTVNILINEGARSDTFALCCMFAIITMFDAMNVRKAVGELTKKYNNVVDDYISAIDKDIKIEKVKVIEGHTLMQVAAGAALGVAVGVIMNFILY